MLSIARAAADGARGGTLAAVVTGAAASARAALARTPQQLDVLARAGVVDAGGSGLLVLLEALAATVTGERPRRRGRRPHVAQPAASAAAATLLTPGLHASGPAYEVMYLIDAADERVPELRSRLDALGDSLVVVGGAGLWNVHVHTDDIAAAIEAGIVAGRPHRLRVTRFADATPASTRASGQPRRPVAVVATASGPGLADVLTAHGAHVIDRAGRTTSTAELLEAVQAVDADSVVVLPDDPQSLAAAQGAASAATQHGLHVAVLPTRAAVQALAAIAVHDPTGPRSEDLVRMAAAAAATRHGAVVAGTATPGLDEMATAGKVHGLVDGHVVEQGSDAAAVAVAVANRMLSAGASC
jgi:dihydroxyacetone kinase-like predicted kinase